MSAAVEVSKQREELSVTAPERRGCCSRGPKEWILKYFWEGQTLNKKQTKALEDIDDDAPFHKRILVRHRRLLAVFIPALFYHIFWWPLMVERDLFHLFEDKYFMSITMIFGSMIAGMTSEGGGAVAFPVMTLAFGIAPAIARDFSLMIQSCGMTAAAFTIFFMRVQLEWHALTLCSLGGAGGIIFGLHVVDPNLTPPQKKMGFVSIWFAFASVLFLINRYRKRRTFKSIPDFNWWKGSLLVVVGFAGGIFSSFAGSGLDICSFSIITLLFRVSEKVATPTSVVLMAGNTVIGFYWRQIMMQEVSGEAWEYLAVCVPIVVFGAPFGSLIGSHFHRLVLAFLVCVLDTVALISAWAIVDLTTELMVASACIVVGGFLFFLLVTAMGQLLLRRYEEKEGLSYKETDSASGEQIGHKNEVYVIEDDDVTKTV